METLGTKCKGEMSHSLTLHDTFLFGMISVDVQGFIKTILWNAQRRMAFKSIRTTTFDCGHDICVIIITLAMYTLIVIKLSSLKSVLNVLPITYNVTELIIAKMDTFERITRTDIDASLNRRLLMNYHI